MGRGRAVAVVIGVLATVAPGAAPSSAAPPDDTFELFVTPTEVAPGGELALEGTCWSEVIGTADDVFVVLSRRVPWGSGLTPYSVHVTLDVDLVDSTFEGVLPVPSDAPGGEYRAGGHCRWDDQAIAITDTEILVLGGSTTTTTSSTTTTSPSSTTMTSEPTTTGPTAGPATAVEGEARLAG